MVYILPTKPLVISFDIGMTTGIAIGEIQKKGIELLKVYNASSPGLFWDWPISRYAFSFIVIEYPIITQQRSWEPKRLQEKINKWDRVLQHLISVNPALRLIPVRPSVWKIPPIQNRISGFYARSFPASGDKVEYKNLSPHEKDALGIMLWAQRAGVLEIKP